jgi:hypothetical protein
LSNKDFKVKNKLQVAGITSAGPLVSDASGNVDSTSSIATQFGGTGTTTSPNSGEFLYSSGGTTYSATSLSSTVPLWSAVSVSSNINISKWNNYMVDTSAARTLTLPASPSQGDEIHIFDVTGTAATNKITVSSNSNKINGTVQDLEIDANNAAVVLIYTGSTYGWSVS